MVAPMQPNILPPTFQASWPPPQGSDTSAPGNVLQMAFTILRLMTLFLALDAPLLPPHRLSPREIWLSPNAREKPPSDPPGVIRIARKLHLKNSVLRDGAIDTKRQAEDHNERGREPRSERETACRYDQDPGGVSGMADEGVGSRGDDVVAAVGLDANCRGKKPIHAHGP